MLKKIKEGKGRFSPYICWKESGKKVGVGILSHTDLAQHTHLWRREPGRKHSVLQSPTQRLSEVHQKLDLGRSDEAA